MYRAAGSPSKPNPIHSQHWRPAQWSSWTAERSLTISITNCTFSGNSASRDSAIANSDTLNLRNTIIANGAGEGDCANFHIIATNVNNLIQDGSCNPSLSGDPKLGPLQDNGGPTFTHALLPGSPAIDAGDDSVLGPPLSLTTDQRGPGLPRKSGLHVDIGA